MATFGRVAPGVPVADMDRAIRFYRDLLGFDVRFTNGSPVSFAVLKQGEAELHLSAEPAKAGSFHAHLTVDDLDGVHERLQQGGATSANTPRFSPGACGTSSSPTPTATPLKSQNPSAKRRR